MENDEKIQQLQKIIDESSSIVFFGGAGVSTESGIPDFRSQDGLYQQQWKYPPETIISRSFFDANTKEFYRFYREKLIIRGAEPNITHKKLAELEAAGKLTAIVTQNIDGLHQKAGSKTVFEVHGTVARNFCTHCHKMFTGDEVKELIDKSPLRLPECDNCGGLIKPDVVLYEEGLDDEVWAGATRHIREADMLIVGGTSLVVYPAAGLINYYRGSKLVLINKSETPYDHEANLVLHMALGEVFSKVVC
jgi:NAD-dependent deacetylase